MSLNGKTNGTVPDTQPRIGTTHRIEFGQMHGYVTINLDDHNDPFEVFIHGFGQYGSTMSGWCDTLSILLSLALQNGIAIEQLEKRFRELTFEPRGVTDDPLVPTCQSLPDYVIQHIKEKYPTKEDDRASIGSHDGTGVHETQGHEEQNALRGSDG